MMQSTIGNSSVMMMGGGGGEFIGGGGVGGSSSSSTIGGGNTSNNGNYNNHQYDYNQFDTATSSSRTMGPATTTSTSNRFGSNSVGYDHGHRNDYSGYYSTDGTSIPSSFLQRLSITIQQEAADMFETIMTTPAPTTTTTTLSDNGTTMRNNQNSVQPTTVYDYLDSTGKIYGRVITILFLSTSNVRTMLIPLSLVSVLFTIPFAIIYGLPNDESTQVIIHPIIAILFGTYLFMIGRCSMIYGIANIYYLGNTTISWKDCLLYPFRCRKLFPLFTMSLLVSFPILFALECIEYIDYTIILGSQDRTTFHFYSIRFLLSILFYLSSYSSLMYLVVVSTKVSMIVPIISLEQQHDNIFAPIYISSTLTTTTPPPSLSSSSSSFQQQSSITTKNDMLLFYTLCVLFTCYWMAEFSIEFMTGNWFVPLNMHFIGIILWTLPTIIFIPIWAVVELVLYINCQVLQSNGTYTQQSFVEQIQQINIILLETTTTTTTNRYSGYFNNRSDNNSSYNGYQYNSLPPGPSSVSVLSSSSSASSMHHDQRQTQLHQHQQQQQQQPVFAQQKQMYNNNFTPSISHHQQSTSTFINTTTNTNNINNDLLLQVNDQQEQQQQQQPNLLL